ncbi:2307_t:CDS:2 [Cetraspora pellucida]|uniref:2307_t:CDS:1 n=1 Tax=Cetraspora pellucida TaxID=1433469 RepID=A0A9N9F3D3_9GLOM|nr:2307_t:CDS:2 [Cetraspora pellucida]
MLCEGATRGGLALLTSIFVIYYKCIKKTPILEVGSSEHPL